jgi:hypothetical protein
MGNQSNMIQQLIEWMQEERRGLPFGDEGIYAYSAAIAKAKELQATEQCKWAVVDKDDVFDSNKDAKNYLEILDHPDYTIVKIIEP